MSRAPWEDETARSWVWHGTRAEYLALQPASQHAECYARSQEYSRPSWWGGDCRSAVEARAMQASGWADGATWARSVLPGIDVPPARCARRRIVRGDWGDTVDPDAALRGDVDVMFTRGVRENRQGARPLSLVVQGSVNCDVSADIYRWRVIVPVLLHDALTAAGYSVSVWCVYGSSGCYPGSRSDESWGAVEVCSPGEPLAIESIAATLGLAGFARTAWFAAMCAVPRAIASGLGHGISSRDGARFWSRVPASLREHVSAGGDAVVLADAHDEATARTACAAALGSLGALAGAPA